MSRSMYVRTLASKLAFGQERTISPLEEKKIVKRGEFKKVGGRGKIGVGGPEK